MRTSDLGTKYLAKTHLNQWANCPLLSMKALGTMLACFPVSIAQKFGGLIFQGDVMRFHTERDKRLHPMRDMQMQAPPPGGSKFVSRRPGLVVQRSIERSRRSKSALQDNGIVDDLLVISMCYEAHLSMQQMLAVFSEMRGGDAEFL